MCYITFSFLQQLHSVVIVLIISETVAYRSAEFSPRHKLTSESRRPSSNQIPRQIDRQTDRQLACVLQSQWNT